MASIKLCHQFCRGIVYPFFLFKLIPHSATDCFFPAIPLRTKSQPTSSFLRGSHLSFCSPLIPNQFHIKHLIHFLTCLCLFLSRLPASILFMLPAVLDHLSFYPRTSIHFFQPRQTLFANCCSEVSVLHLQVMWPAFNLWHLLAAVFYYQWNQSLIDKLQTTRELKVSYAVVFLILTEIRCLE